MKDAKDSGKSRPGRPAAVFYASDNLRRLYKERIEPTMTQKQFATRYGIGGQSMIAQILSGAKALPIETAPKIARALHCTIDEICPEMAEFVREELLPAVGKALRRVAVFAVVAIFVSLLYPATPSYAGKPAQTSEFLVYYVNLLLREIMRRVMRFARLCSLACRVSACTISAWLRRCARPSRLRSGARRVFPRHAVGFLWPFSSQSWPRNTPTSSRLFATQ